MSNGESTRISAAVGMQLSNQRIGRRMTAPRGILVSDAIHDTLETTDGESNAHIQRNADSNPIAEEPGENDSVLPGDVLDISG